MAVKSREQLFSIVVTERHPLFAMKSQGYEPNGNIQELRWKITNRAPKYYTYGYDPLNRVGGAGYGYFSNSNPGGGSASGGGITAVPSQEYSVLGISYDAVGNITYIQRNGMVPAGGCFEPKEIDNLSLIYDPSSNRLNKVTDSAPADGRPYGFKPGGDDNALYQHDANGNLTYDPNKGLSMQYNFLNLPTQASLMKLVYDATGRKWLKYGEFGVTGYASGIEYHDGKIEAIYTPDGRMVAEYQGGQAARYRAEYFHQDHLGNTRLVFSDFNQNGLIELTEEDPTTPLNEFEITQEAHYYPFGMGHLGPWYETVAPENKYLYNGKELSEDYEIDLMDYGARWYDGAIGRWNAVDPLAEKYAGWSPYNYVMGNPIRLVDPDGQSVTDDYKLRQNGKLELIRKTEEKFDRITTEDGSKSIEVTKISSIVEGNSGQVLWFNNAESGRKYYEFAAENTNVEFAMIEGEYPAKNYKEVTVGTSYEEKSVGNQPSIAKSLSKGGFVADLVSHSHPDITSDPSVPTGHYGYQKGNPNSLMPDKSGYGDAGNAIAVKKLKGFENATFEVFSPSQRTITTYDGINKAVVRKKN